MSSGSKQWYGWPGEPMGPALPAEFGEEERQTEGGRGGFGLGAGPTGSSLRSGNDMAITWGEVYEHRRLRMVRALVMLAVALAIFAGACWLVAARGHRTNGQAVHACAEGRR